jgi:hypothetical protein
MVSKNDILLYTLSFALFLFLNRSKKGQKKLEPYVIVF